MKKLILQAILLALGNLLFAQNIKFHGANYSYLDIPKTIRQTDENTFTVVLRSYANLDYIGTSKDQLANRISFNTISKVEGFGDIDIKITIGRYSKLSPKLNKVEKDGVVTGYYYTCDYNVPFSYSVVSPSINWNNTGTKETTEGNKYTYTQKTFKTYDEASKNWSEGNMANVKGHLRSSIENLVSNLGNLISYNTEFIERSMTVTLYDFKTTKKEDFTAYENANDKTKAIFESVKGTTVRAELMDQLKPHIDFWSTNLKTLNPSEKDDQRLHFVNAYDLGITYFILDDMENAKKYLKEAMITNEKKAATNQLEKLIEEREADLKILEGTTISPYEGLPNASNEKVMELNDKYFKEKERIELEKQIEIEKALAIYEKENAPVINEYEGYIVDRDEKMLEGMFKEYLDNTGDKEGNTYFIENETTKEIALSTANMLECHFDDRDYEAVRYFTVGDGFEKDLMYIIFESEKVNVYKGGNGYIYFKKPEEKNATNTNSLIWGTSFKKSATGYFSDCASLVTKIEAGDYPASNQMRIAMAKDYTTLCK